MQTEEFLKDIRGRTGVHTNEDARRIISAVFHALYARIPRETGENAIAQLPSGIKEMWHPGVVDETILRVTGPERMDLDEFLERVRDKASLKSVDEARAAAEAVVVTMREQITPGAAHKIEMSLPEDIREFWRTSAPEELPPVEKPPTQAEGERPEEQIDLEGLGPAAAQVERADHQLSEEIVNLLRATEEVDANQIDVHVSAGRVTLRGTVDTFDQREMAARVVSEAVGATEVENELQVAP